MRLIIASNNKHKICEIKEILDDFFSEIISLSEAEIYIDVEESGSTFEENAKIKANAISELLPNDAILSDDSGLCVDYINGAPGVYSARYSGEGHDDKKNNSKLLDALENAPDNKRGAKFVSCIVLKRPDQEDIIVSGYCHGHIGHEEIGDGGFGYDPIFYPDGMGVTFAQLTGEQKNSISHRANSLKELKKLLIKES